MKSALLSDGVAWPRFIQALVDRGDVLGALEGQQRVGALAEVPQLLRDLGVDPAEVAADVGLDLSVLHEPENAIPFPPPKFGGGVGWRPAQTSAERKLVLLETRTQRWPFASKSRAGRRRMSQRRPQSSQERCHAQEPV